MKVSLIIGSASDKAIAKTCVDVLKQFDIPYEVRVISAHRALNALQAYCEQERETTSVYIAMAGKSAHLAGVIAGMNIQPVIGVPIKSSPLDGMDALLSTVQMPSGVPVATVAIDGGANAALLAIQILATSHVELREKLYAYKETLSDKVSAMNESLDM